MDHSDHGGWTDSTSHPSYRRSLCVLRVDENGVLSMKDLKPGDPVQSSGLQGKVIKVEKIEASAAGHHARENVYVNWLGVPLPPHPRSREDS